MKCSESRSLFAARIDYELSAEESFDHDRHLSSCNSCQGEWKGYHTTVDLVRELPKEVPNPSFVGQVLDRVRAFEANAIPTYIDPSDIPVADPEEDLAPSAVSRMKAILAGWVQLVRPGPAFVTASAVLGVALGFFVTREGPVPGTRGQVTDHGSTTQAVLDAPSERNGNVIPSDARVPPEPPRNDNATGPFADLAGELESLPSAEGEAGAAIEVVTPSEYLWQTRPGYQQQVRSNDRPRITF